ncbi:MAG: hypothetical protein FJY85_01985 [Deltaproteobacteria bacterium]|nr:hypothetical protein [Deltaproteobacteria bacterium]
MNHEDTKTQRHKGNRYRTKVGAHLRVRPNRGRHVGLPLPGLLVSFDVPLIKNGINAIDFFVSW